MYAHLADTEVQCHRFASDEDRQGNPTVKAIRWPHRCDNTVRKSKSDRIQELIHRTNCLMVQKIESGHARIIWSALELKRIRKVHEKDRKQTVSSK